MRSPRRQLAKGLGAVAIGAAGVYGGRGVHGGRGIYGGRGGRGVYVNCGIEGEGPVSRRSTLVGDDFRRGVQR